MSNKFSAMIQIVANSSILILVLSILPAVGYCQADNTAAVGPKAFIDYFQPVPVSGQLSKEVWGAATVGPRDPNNGLEDPTMKHWNYWDGKILRGPDGKYRMFASRWDQAMGHTGWFRSNAVEARIGVNGTLGKILR